MAELKEMGLSWEEAQAKERDRVQLQCMIVALCPNRKEVINEKITIVIIKNNFRYIFWISDILAELLFLLNFDNRFTFSSTFQVDLTR